MEFETPPFQRDQKRRIPTSDAIVAASRSGEKKSGTGFKKKIIYYYYYYYYFRDSGKNVQF